MSIQSEITRLSNAKASLKTAIEGKGVTVSGDAKLDAYPALVESIPTGGGDAGPLEVKFVSLITGELIKVMNVEYGYTMKAADFPTLENLSVTVDHPAFNFSKWHGAAAGSVIKSNRTILAVYDKVDKTTSQFIGTFSAGQVVQINVQSGATIDWGDGSEPEPYSDAWMSHTYATAGRYTVTMSGTLKAGLSYYRTICPFDSIFLGTSSVTFGSSNMADQGLKPLKILYIGDATSDVANYSFMHSGLRYITLGTGVTAVKTSAFSGCVDLVGFYSAASALTIGNNAFNGCTGLEDITIPAMTGTYGTYIFQACTNLRHVALSSGQTKIGTSMFTGCVSLVDVEIPASVDTLSLSSFYECKSLPEIVLPNAITTISQQCFASCKSLRHVSFPANLTTIESSAFKDCGLLELNLPATVSSIGTDAFLGCMYVEDVTIPAALTTIPGSMLYDMYNLIEIDVPATVSTISGGAFSYASTPTCYHRIVRMASATPPTLSNASAFKAAAGLRIIVPAGSLSDYQSATQWSALATYIEEAAA